MHDAFDGDERHVAFELAQCVAYARRVNPRRTVMPLSAMRGEGLDPGYELLRARRDATLA